MERSSGILMPISSLPSPYGIGTFGKAAYEFVDFLADADQRWWQILPVSPTSYGDSPYQSPSAFAGNPYFIDLELLMEDGLLLREEAEMLSWGENPSSTDYGLLYENRLSVLRKAVARGYSRDIEEVRSFEEANSSWLPDYALFMALKKHFGMRSWQDWPDEEARLRADAALEHYKKALDEEIRFHVYIQYLFFKQWNELRKYAHEHGIGIIGDIPLYVALDSADVWSSPQNFQLDAERIPREVAGVPPDMFTEDGQLWGNPLYDYTFMKQDGFARWVRRIEGASALYDVIRIDHFRGLESYWTVPYGDTTAKNGRWVEGPGMALVQVLKDHFPDIRFIAEDLGYPTPQLAAFLRETGFPGMKVLEFAFDSRDSGDYLPHTYSTTCVCYAGTHDNDTLLGWLEHAEAEDVAKARDYLGLNEAEGTVWGFIRGGMGSVAGLFVAQMQDYLELGADARMNTPGSIGGNWRWRMKPGAATGELAAKIRHITELYGRDVH